jgi:hypothetical protein
MDAQFLPAPTAGFAINSIFSIICLRTPNVAKGMRRCATITRSDALVAHGHMAHDFQANMNDRVLAHTKSAYPVGVNDWSTHAADGRCLTGLARNALGEDWRLYVIGHDGLLRFFSSAIEAWHLTAPPGRAKEAPRGDGRLS